MIYRNFGGTGAEVSLLGFGCMRFPVKSLGENSAIDEDTAIRMLRRAYELGVNYFDTAFFYGEGKSEIVLGKALRGIRNDVYISTKCHDSYVQNPGDLRRILEQQLEKLGTDYIDFYHLHGIRFSTFTEADQRAMWLRDMWKARDEGLIKHLSFSTHDVPENSMKLINLGVFETILCQYNLIDQRNEEVLAYASARGLGVAVMGPLGGGRIPEQPGEPASKVRNHVETALKFVFSNPNVDCVLSGMTSIGELEENAAIASTQSILSNQEKTGINGLKEQKKKLADLYCTGCSYCLPCPVGVGIPSIFRITNYLKVSGLEEYAKQKYLELGQGAYAAEKKADACIACGKCEKICPQGIEIRKQLKESHQLINSD